MASILIVEDDPKTAAAIAEGLQCDGQVTRTAVNGTTGDGMLSQSSFDAHILDWMLPGMSGIDVLAMPARGQIAFLCSCSPRATISTTKSWVSIRGGRLPRKALCPGRVVSTRSGAPASS